MKDHVDKLSEATQRVFGGWESITLQKAKQFAIVLSAMGKSTIVRKYCDF